MQDLPIEQLDLIYARKHFGLFVQYVDRTFSAGWVHALVCNALDQFLADVIAKKSPRLMITMPPRHGKSQLVSRLFPAFALGRFPDLSFIGTSYSAGLADSFSKDIQRIIDSDEYRAVFPDTQLGTGKTGDALRQTSVFEIRGHKGRYRSAGVGGGITGHGGEILLVDDPFKDHEDADSATQREKVWNWYTSTLYTRKAPGAGIIVINTRWHCDDLSGKLLDAEARGQGDKWQVLNFPAIAEHDERYRKTGEALHPERYDLQSLEQIKTAIGSRDWQALYQQHPVPDGGALFKAEWLKHWSAATLPTMDRIIESWDMTFKDGAHSDFVVGQVWGKKGANYYLLDQVRGRWDFVHTLSMVRLLSQNHPKAWTKLVEEKANGAAVMSSLHSTVGGFVPIVPKESKEARAFAITPLFESGNVYLPPLETDWVHRDLIPELMQFPSGAHDDQVDAMTQALSYLKEFGSGYAIGDD
jgi:predicted phage terminase large subunit-like protein